MVKHNVHHNTKFSTQRLVTIQIFKTFSSFFIFKFKLVSLRPIHYLVGWQEGHLACKKWRMVEVGTA